jgi:hypothetical protein
MSETSRVRDWTQKGLTSKLTSGSVTGKRARALEGNDPEKPRLIELKMERESWVMKVTALNGQNLICLLV